MPVDTKNFHTLDPDYAKYPGLADYLLQSAKRSMNELFRRGITVNGKKIKFKE